jgi:t-SNARE complex subunit (syntaxin)
MSYYNNQAYEGPNVSTVNAQVRDLQDIMKQNIEKGMNRGVNLEQLSTNIEDLENNATQFNVTSNKTKSKFIWKNRKWTCILIVVIILIVLILVGIIVAIVMSATKK